MNRRRRALALLLGFAASGVFGGSTPPKRRIGFLTSATTPSQREDFLRSGLKELGWIEGENLTIDYRRAGNSADRLVEMAKDLIARQVELIVASSTPAVVAARNVSSTVPIVTISADPVGTGFAESLRRPGGNVTGISTITADLAGKRLEFLKELQPGLRRVAFLGYKPDPAHRQFVSALEDAGKTLSVHVDTVLIESAGELGGALLQLPRVRSEAIVVQTLLPIMGMSQPIAEFALRARLTTCSDSPAFVTAGGLLSYGYDPAVTDKRVAIFVDRVLKGGRPAEIPIETPQKFLLMLNLKTARSLGIRVPDAILLRADRVVE
jgi:putative ABC transport system substrate-binding protein